MRLQFFLNSPIAIAIFPKFSNRDCNFPQIFQSRLQFYLKFPIAIAIFLKFSNLDCNFTWNFQSRLQLFQNFPIAIAIAKLQSIDKIAKEINSIAIKSHFYSLIKLFHSIFTRVVQGNCNKNFTIAIAIFPNFSNCDCNFSLILQSRLQFSPNFPIAIAIFPKFSNRDCNFT